MPSEPGSSEDIVVEVDIDMDEIRVLPQGKTSSVYTYPLSGNSELLDKLTDRAGTYTIYSQGEELSKEEYELLKEYYG